MKPLVVFESTDDGSAEVARIVADCLSAPLLTAADARPRDLEIADLLVLGGPTHRRGAGPALRTLLEAVPAGWLAGVRTATFDTRPRRPRLLTGSAARSLARTARAKGAVIVVRPRSFFVAGQHGPLLDGQPDAAADWAAAVAQAIHASKVGPEPPKHPSATDEFLSLEYPHQLVTPLAVQGVSRIRRSSRRKERPSAQGR
jgi:hypothetical protein